MADTLFLVSHEPTLTRVSPSLSFPSSSSSPPPCECTCGGGMDWYCGDMVRSDEEKCGNWQN